MNYKQYKLFRQYPHLFGHYIGMKDLIELHSEWVYKAWVYDTPALQAHRNSYKTSSIIILGHIWYNLFINQDKTILLIRKSRDEAWKISKNLKDFYLSKEVEYIAKELELIKRGTLRTENWSNNSFTLASKKTKTPEGSLDVIGMGGAITGAHYDKIFPDDIITIKDRTSKAERESTKDYIRELRNIIKEGGKIFFSGTPWHKEDGWTIIPKPKQYPIGTVPIKGYLSHQLEEKRKELKNDVTGTTASLYAANYLLKHIADENRIFPEPIYKEWPSEFKKLISYLDPAYKGDNTTALTLLGITKEGTYHVRGWVWLENIVDIYPQVVEKCIRYNVGSLYVEENADQGAAYRDIKQIYPSAIPRREKMNKHNRIISYAKQHWDKFHFANDCDEHYMNQVLDYEEGQDPDDAADSLAGASREMGLSGQVGGKVGRLTGW